MKPLYTTTLTGTKQGKLSSLPSAPQPGDQLSIHRRPDNAYDSQAMSVHFGPYLTDPFIGWVPAKEYEDRIVKGVLFNLMAHGIPLIASVESYDPDTKTLVVIIGMPKECVPAPDMTSYICDDLEERKSTHG